MKTEISRQIVREIAHLAADASTPRGTNQEAMEHLANAQSAVRRGWIAQANSEIDSARRALGY